MTPDQWHKVRAVFDEACERPPGDRALWLRVACGGDEIVRAEVERLVAADDRAGAFLDAPPSLETASGLLDELVPVAAGQRIGPYRIVRELGRGGMASVYLAERDDDAYRKQVAIKLARNVGATPSAQRRFRDERQILADLEHPNIARLLDGGTTEEGLPYLVMEYVEGVAIDAYCAGRKLSIPERLELFCQVCGAVHYAHQHLVVHRDIKASNVLVTAEGTPKLLDFGIAKLLYPADVDGAATATAERLLTPETASPEQIRGQRMTTASDVYQLGLLLYRLVTGQGPYRSGSELPHELARAICEEEPQRPSALVAPRRVQNRVKGDLDTILLKALRKEPERRYATADALRADVERHLEGLPVAARAESLAYRVGRFVRRHKLGVAATALVFLSLVGGLVATIWQARIADKHAQVALQQRARAVAQERANWRLLYAARTNLAGQEWRAANVPRMTELLDSLRPVAGREDLRGFEWYYLWKLAHSERRAFRHDGWLEGAAISPDGRRLAVAGALEPPHAYVWDIETGRQLAVLAGHSALTNTIEFSPDGRTLLTASDDGTARLWDPATAQATRVLSGHGGPVLVARFSPDGTRIVTGSTDRTAKLWDVAGHEVATLRGHSDAISAAAFSADGRWLATGSYDESVKLWDASDLRELATLRDERPGQVSGIAFSPDGAHLVVTGQRFGGEADGVAVWNLPSRKLMPVPRAQAACFAAAFSPDGRTLAIACHDRTALLWSMGEERVTKVIRGHGDAVTAVRFASDGKTLVTASRDGTAKIWDVGVEQEPTRLDVREAVASIAISSDGVLAIATSYALMLWDAVGGRELARFGLPEAPPASVALSPDGEKLALLSRTDASVTIWDVKTHARVVALPGRRPLDAGGAELRPRSLAFSPDGRTLAAIDGDHGVTLWTTGTWQQTATLEGHRENVLSLAISPDSTLLATASRDKTAKLWNLDRRQAVHTLGGYTGWAKWIGFAPEGTRVATASVDGTVRFWDVASGRETMRIARGGDTGSAAFSPDGRRIVVSGRGEPSFTIFDTRTGEPLLTLVGHGAPVFAIAFSPDGNTLISGSQEGTVRLWRAATADLVARAGAVRPAR